ncbi:GntR family transcriptional regulator [Pseudomonas putida]|uniref:FadR/GntR family transcriptional regulator n=1 Tax=Pseudomonas putida TaxID=303 RepID=UPI00236494A3|nr:GntR family transcriptional regulator [Pseudomonas putida]MDD1963807.1 GntR family transcriptional regulator [Pseudomonas putida]
MLYGISPIKSVATYGAAAERIRQEITLGNFLPGAKLPAERKFSDELGVARITLREALKLLDSEGYFEIRRGVNGGTFIVDELKLEEIGIAQLNKSQSACLRAMEYWRINQVACARFAAVRRSPADLKRMREALEALRQEPERALRRRAESELCLSVAAATGNIWLADAAHDSLAASYLPFVPLMSQDQHFSLLMVEELISSIHDHQEEQATELMASVCETFIARFKALLIRGAI